MKNAPLFTGIAAFLLSAGVCAQTFQLEIDDPDCRVPLTGPVNFETDAASGATIFKTTAAGPLPGACPGTGASVSLSASAAEIDRNDPVTLSWSVPEDTSFDCALTRSGVTIRNNAQVSRPSGSYEDSPIAQSTYEMRCDRTLSGVASGADSRVDVVVNGGDPGLCGTPIPRNSQRTTPFEWRRNSSSGSGTTFEQIFGPWPGNSNANFTIRLGSNRYISMPFMTDANGIAFLLSYEQAVPPGERLRVTVSECIGGFASASALCEFDLSGANNEARIIKSECGLTDGVQYYLNLIWVDADGDAAGCESGFGFCDMLLRPSGV